MLWFFRAFQETQERLDLIRSLETKYGKTIPEVLQALEEKKARLQELENYDELREQAEKELKYMEKQRNQLQPIINSIDKELKNSGQIKLVLPEVGALELASTYRNKKIKPLCPPCPLW